jgi:hypothetical protein
MAINLWLNVHPRRELGLQTILWISQSVADGKGKAGDDCGTHARSSGLRGSISAGLTTNRLLLRYLVISAALVIIYLCVEFKDL